MSLNAEPNPPLFTIILHFWIKLFGLEANVVRLVPLFFNSITIVFLYKTAQKISGNIAAVLTSCIFLFSTAHFYFALETRTYSLISLCTAAAIYFYINLQENPKSRGHFIALLITNLVMVYCHYFSWFILFNEFLFAIVFFRNRVFFLRILANLGLIFIAYIPITLSVIRQFQKSSKGTWVDPPYDGQIWNEIYFWVNGHNTLNELLYIVGAGIILVLILALFKKYKPKTEQSKMLLFYALWFAIPFLIMYSVSFSIPMFINRYILFNSISLYLLIGAFVEYAFGFYAIIGWCVTAFLSIQMITPIEIGSKDFAYREVSKSVAMVKAEKTPETFVFLYPVWDEFPFNYYYDRTIFRDYEHKDQLMADEKIVQIWGVETCRDVINRDHPKKIILYEDGTFPPDIHSYLDSLYTRTDSVFFPQTTLVTVFEAKK
jgi:mannosyltransferase